jgi:hypothetical protein
MILKEPKLCWNFGLETKIIDKLLEEKYIKDRYFHILFDNIPHFARFPVTKLEYRDVNHFSKKMFMC